MGGKGVLHKAEKPIRIGRIREVRRVRRIGRIIPLSLLAKLKRRAREGGGEG